MHYVSRTQIPAFLCVSQRTADALIANSTFGPVRREGQRVLVDLAAVERYAGRRWHNPPTPETPDDVITVTREQLTEFEMNIRDVRDAEWRAWLADPQIRLRYFAGPPQYDDEPNPVPVKIQKEPDHDHP